MGATVCDFILPLQIQRYTMIYILPLWLLCLIVRYVLASGLMRNSNWSITWITCWCDRSDAFNWFPGVTFCLLLYLVSIIPQNKWFCPFCSSMREEREPKLIDEAVLFHMRKLDMYSFVLLSKCQFVSVVSKIPFTEHFESHDKSTGNTGMI